MASPTIQSFLDAYVQALRDRNAAIFAGAGLSIPAGMVNWKRLLSDIAREIGLDVDKEDDLISVAQYHVNERGGRDRLNEKLLNEFSRRARLTQNHRILASLPIRTYWTTNYDGLLEGALRREGKRPDVKMTVENLATTLHDRDAVVYKMHGDVSLPDKAILTKDDYEAYNSTHQLFSSALQGDLVSKTFLFVGFSFTDPNLAYILSRIRLLLDKNARTHYCLMRRVQRSDFGTAAAYRYALGKQELQVKDLRRYGIQGILVDDFAEYTTILERIATSYRQSSILVSGSAATYTPWPEKDAQELIQLLAGEIIREGCEIVTGLGGGVGPLVINGALAELERGGTRHMDERLIMRPFPQGFGNAAERASRWTKYRKDMLKEAGIALFLFGNKADAGAIVDADGMEEEFELAVANGLKVVPVGCTGYTAAKLHSRVAASFGDFYPQVGYKVLFEKLASPGTPGQVAQRVLAMVRKIREQGF